MASHAEELCEFWDETPLPAHSHSLLYHLDPIGIGTPMAERLTSYIARLADAHSVHLTTFVAKAIVPHLDSPSQTRQPYAYRTSFWAGSAVLNSVTPLTEQLVQILERLTMCQDLRFLTMLPWKAVLPQQQLVRRTQAWCAVCFEEWRAADQVVYEPLLWALREVQRCPVHSCVLQSTCPFCSQTHPPLTPHAQPGYCSSCNRWLGSRSSGETALHPLSQAELQWYQWGESEVGTLIAVAPRFSSPFSRHNIARAAEKVTNGNQLASARRLHVTQTSIWKWLGGESVPQLGTLLRICFRMGISPLAFLTGVIEPLAPPREETLSLPMKNRQSRPYKRFDVERMRSILEATLQRRNEPPPSMEALARSLGYDQTIFRRYFPDLCKAVSKRYLDYLREKRLERIQRVCDELRQVMLSLHAQGYYPGQRQLEKLLSKPTCLMEPEVNRAWRQIIEELGVRPTK